MKGRETAGIFFRGMAMGMADLIPGVSGGTIALITGIYDRLIRALTSFDLQAISALRDRAWEKFWRQVDGKFLLLLLSGIVCSLAVFSRLIHFWLTHHRVLLWAFFFGLVAASSYIVFRQIRKWRIEARLAFPMSFALAYGVSVISPVQTSEAFWMIFLSGLIAISAMLLPGISGSFLLLLMGKYDFLISAVKNIEVLILVVFGSGCAIGFLSFSHAIRWTLTHHRDTAMAILSGFMLGSLFKVWPWKKVISTTVDRHGEVRPLLEQNISPWTYAKLNPSPGNQWEWVLLLLVSSVAVVLIMDRIALRSKPS